MSLDLSEFIDLSEDTVALLLRVGDAFGASSPGGKRITKAEALAIKADAVALIKQLETDIGD